MKPLEFCYNSADGTKLKAYKWAAEQPKAVVQIAHGAVEHAMRYADFAKTLAQAGYSVYAADIRGHGATAGAPEKVAYFSDKNGGFMQAVDDMAVLSALLRGENPGLPVFLLGHSMGSLLSRVYAAKHGDGLSGVILTGTGRVSPPLIVIVRILARCVMVLFGRRHVSPFLHSLVFGTLNRPFGGETGSEFICSDEAVIQAYADDPYCGNTVTAEFAYELLSGTRAAAKKSTIDGYPKEVPLLIASGELDSMGGAKLAAVKKDVQAYRRTGVRDLEFKVYPGMRHEILNEREKRLVYADIIAWLDARLKA